MKIAIDARMLGRHLHGHGRVIWATVEQLARKAPHDHFVMLGDSPWARQLAQQNANVGVRKIAARPFTLREQWQIPASLWNERPDLYHATTAAIPLLRPVPYVMTIPDLIPLIFSGHLPRYRFYFGRWLPWAARRARRVLAPSEAARADLCRYLRLPSSHVTVIPHGLQPNFQPATEPDEATRLAVRYGVRPPFLLMAGNPRPHKNLPHGLALLDRLLPALADDVQVVVLSAEGPLLSAAVARFSQPARLRSVTYVEEEDLPALYRQAHVFFYPSLYEGFGLQVAEAMACGTVVVSSSASSLAEVVGDGGLLVDVSDERETLRTLRAACLEEQTRVPLREAALRRAAHFSWAECADRTLSVYREVC